MNITNILAASVFISLAVGLGVFLLVPRRTRPEIFFSVTVDASFRESEPGREILRKFSRQTVLWTAAVAIMAALAFWCEPALAYTFLFGAMAFQIAGVMLAFVRARKKVWPHRVEPSREREAQLTPNDTPPVGGWLGQLGPFLVLAVFALVIGLKWPEIPARFPMHWGANGKADSWADKSWASVFLLPMLGVLVCGLLGAMNLSLQRGVRRIHASGAKRANESAFLRQMLWVLLGAEYFVAVLLGVLAFLPLMTSGGHTTLPMGVFVIPSIIFPISIIAAALVIAAKSGQGGSHLSTAQGVGAAAERRPVGDRTPDECWKGGGLFYYNPDDPALWVEKRFGVGWTINFAHRGTWFMLGGLVLFGVLSIILPMLLLR